VDIGLQTKPSQQTTTDNPEDKFSSPAPQYKQPKIPYHADYLTPEDKDHNPSPAVVQLLRNKGNDKLAQILEQAKSNAKKHAATLERQIAKRTPGKTPTHTHPRKQEQVHYCEAHILSDADFITYTRDLTIDFHTRAITLLVYANGGERFISQGMNLAQALDCMRRERQARLHYKDVEVVSLRDVEVKSYTPGVPTNKDRFRKLKQAAVIHKDEEEKQ
jgi:hypothetical protein